MDQDENVACQMRRQHWLIERRVFLTKWIRYISWYLTMAGCRTDRLDITPANTASESHLTFSCGAIASETLPACAKIHLHKKNMHSHGTTFRGIWSMKTWFLWCRTSRDAAREWSRCRPHTDPELLVTTYHKAINRITIIPASEREKGKKKTSCSPSFQIEEDQTGPPSFRWASSW